MTVGTDFEKRGKCNYGHCSPMSIAARCDLNSKGDILKLHDMCSKPKCCCQKRISFTPRQFQLEEAGFKSKMAKLFKGTPSAWNMFLNPVVDIAAPFIGMSVGAKTKNPKVAQALTNILKSLSGGRVLPLTGI